MKYLINKNADKTILFGKIYLRFIYFYIFDDITGETIAEYYQDSLEPTMWEAV